jgi:hypothetical protein
MYASFGKMVAIDEDVFGEGNRTIENGVPVLSLSHGSYGRGCNINVGIDITLNDFLQMGVIFEYFKGHSISTELSDVNSLAIVKSFAKYFSIIPAFTVQLLQQPVNVRIQTGLSLVPDGMIIENRTSTANMNPLTNFSTQKIYRENFSIGFINSMVITKKLFSKIPLELGFKISLRNSSIAPDKSEILSYKVSGVELVHTLTIRERFAIYKDEYFTNRFDVNRPDKIPVSLNRSYTSSGLALSIILNYTLNFKRKS